MTARTPVYIDSGKLHVFEDGDTLPPWLSPSSMTWENLTGVPVGLTELAALTGPGYAKLDSAGAWSVQAAIPQADVSGLTTALAGLQPISARLTAIAGLTDTAGWLHDDGSGAWSISVPTKSDVGLSLVENTALSTWGGSANLATLGTVATGIWHGTAIADAYISSAATWNAKEGGLGNPSTSGYLLSSTSAGVRSWVAPYSLPTATASVLGGVKVGTGLAISSGALSVAYGTAAGTACAGNDSRLSDSRTPTAHALDGALHTISGKTAGQVLVATGATTFGFATISGDAALSGAGALTLATLLTAGSAGSATTVPTLTWDAKGRLTAAGSAAISIPHTQINDWSTATSGFQTSLGFTPVQQGGGPSMGANKVYIGWGTDSVLRLQVDATNFGSTWPINITGSCSNANNANTLGGNSPAYYATASSLSNYLPLADGTLTGALHISSTGYLDLLDGIWLINGSGNAQLNSLTLLGDLHASSYNASFSTIGVAGLATLGSISTGTIHCGGLYGAQLEGSALCLDYSGDTHYNALIYAGKKSGSSTCVAYIRGSDGYGYYEALGFFTPTGTNLGFLKADGSTDYTTYLTGNQSITLSGVVTGSGTTSIATSFANTHLAGINQELTTTSSPTFNYLTLTNRLQINSSQWGAGISQDGLQGDVIGYYSTWDANKLFINTYNNGVGYGAARFSGVYLHGILTTPEGISTTTLTASGLITANGGISGNLTGHASLDLPLTGGTMSGNLLGGTPYNIGASTNWWGSIYATTIYESNVALSSKYLGINASIQHTQISDWATATSSFLTANQSISLTGAVTGSGTTSIATSFANTHLAGINQDLTTTSSPTFGNANIGTMIGYPTNAWFGYSGLNTGTNYSGFYQINTSDIGIAALSGHGVYLQVAQAQILDILGNGIIAHQPISANSGITGNLTGHASLDIPLTGSSAITGALTSGNQANFGSSGYPWGEAYLLNLHATNLYASGEAYLLNLHATNLYASGGVIAQGQLTALTVGSTLGMSSGGSFTVAGNTVLSGTFTTAVNSQTASYTIVASDQGKMILSNSQLSLPESGIPTGFWCIVNWHVGGGGVKFGPTTSGTNWYLRGTSITTGTSIPFSGIVSWDGYTWRAG